MKSVEVEAVPFAVVTLIGPVLAPCGTTVVMDPVSFDWIEALWPLKVTPWAPSRLEPLIRTAVPAGPLVGETLEMTGGTVKLVEVVAVPAAVVTRIGLVLAPCRTTVMMEDLESNRTEAAEPLVGEKLEMTGDPRPACATPPESATRARTDAATAARILRGCLVLRGASVARG